jgi:hypothetical protein
VLAMLCFVKKISFVAVLFTGVLFQTCQSPSGAEDNLDPKRFDGKTSATGQKFHIDSVRVSPTYADLYWWDFWDDGDTQSIRYGTDQTYSLGTIDLKPVTAETSTKTTISPLTPNTHYYVQFYRFYDGSPIGSVKIDFTTPEAILP